MHKHKSMEKAPDVLARIAANNVEFHKGHSQLPNLLSPGQAAACFTCYSHHYPERKRKGAPVNYMLVEGAAGIIAVAVMKNAPSPKPHGYLTGGRHLKKDKKIYAQGGRTPAHPKVEPKEKIRPKAIYPVGVEDLKQFSKYEKIWKEISNLR